MGGPSPRCSACECCRGGPDRAFLDQDPGAGALAVCGGLCCVRGADMLYRCRFGYRLPLGDGMISLRFGGVYYSARVWLNGVLLGEHEGYFAPFEFDVTGILADGENEL